MREEQSFSLNWDAPYYASFPEAAGIILIGGGKTTRISGLVGIAIGIPVLAIAAFGGESEGIVKELQLK